MENGDPLSDWLKFDEKSVLITGNPNTTAAAHANLNLKLICQDQFNRTASTRFKIMIENIPPNLWRYVAYGSLSK